MRAAPEVNMRPTPPLSSTTERIRPPVFAELQGRIDRLVAEGRVLVPLHIGDTCVMPPEAARRAMTTLDGEDETLLRYGPTAGLLPLRRALATTLSRRGIDVDATNDILVGNGATHALYCAARAVLDPGDEVLLASPYWPLAPGIFTACGAINVEVPLTQRLYETPSLDVADVFRSKITPRTKALYFISPNNPDGKVLARAHVDAILEVAKEYDLWIFADEVYADTVFDGTHVSMLDVPGARDRTIVAHSLSKSHALSGCRVGFVVATPPVIASARRVSTHTAFNVPVAMQRVAEAALGDAGFAKAARDGYRRARDVAAKALEGSGIRFFMPEGATYLFLDCRPVLGEGEGARPLLGLLEHAVERGVILAPGDAFGQGFASFARLCFTSVPEHQLREGVSGLRHAIDTFASQRTA